MEKKYLVNKEKTVEKVKLGEKYYNIEEKIEVENPIEIVGENFQDLNVYKRCEIILATIGIDIELLNPYQIICHILRFLPMLERLLHTIELGAPSTGKSSTFQKCSPKYYCSSGSFTEPSLFGSKNLKKKVF